MAEASTRPREGALWTGAERRRITAMRHLGLRGALVRFRSARPASRRTEYLRRKYSPGTLAVRSSTPSTSSVQRPKVLPPPRVGFTIVVASPVLFFTFRCTIVSSLNPKRRGFFGSSSFACCSSSVFHRPSQRLHSSDS